MHSASIRSLLQRTVVYLQYGGGNYTWREWRHGCTT